MRAIRVGVAALSLAAGLISAQPRPVDPMNSYERLLCVVPIVGAGTKADPKRPLYAPLRLPGTHIDEGGILAFVSLPSEDGRFALVEFVAKHRTAFNQIFDEKRQDVKVFIRGKAGKADIEREFRKYVRNFDLEKFGVALP